MGAVEIIENYEELQDYKKVGSPFSIPKAALTLAGFAPEFSAENYASLEEHLKAFGAGLEITLLAAIPAGSGLGTVPFWLPPFSELSMISADWHGIETIFAVIHWH